MKLVEKGLDLGLALREAVETISSEAEGGGHNIAAGARIPQGTEKILIENLNIAIDKQFDEREEQNKKKSVKIETPPKKKTTTTIKKEPTKKSTSTTKKKTTSTKKTE
jgi:hypothetical protein